MKDNWETKANKPDVETTGGEKPLGKQKNNKKTKMWRPMGVKSHWGNKKNINNNMWIPMGIEKPFGKQKEQNVETNGVEKPLGHQKKQKNKMWRPIGVKNHWEIKKKTKNPKCGDQWG